jgi:hypothetical protein
MNDSKIKDIINRSEALKQKFASAETEVKIRTRQLDELTPKKKDIDRRCKENFGCKISELPSKLEEITKQIESDIAIIESKLEEANQSEEQGD